MLSVFNLCTVPVSIYIFIKTKTPEMHLPNSTAWYSPLEFAYYYHHDYHHHHNNNNGPS